MTKYTQKRTIDADVEIRLTIDLSYKGLSLSRYSKNELQSRIEALVLHLISCPNDYCEVCEAIQRIITISVVRSKLILDSLRVFSKKVQEEEEDLE